MDGAKAFHLYSTVKAELIFKYLDALTSRKVAGVAWKALSVNLARAAPGADLGGSSKYSREALEDRCGERFRVNSR